MAFYIRKGNKVLEQVNTPSWSEITSTTKYITVAAFTTRRDAEMVRAQLNDVDAVVSNNLEYCV